MSRRHWDLKGDEEVNTAQWVAARGAVVGAAKVRPLIAESATRMYPLDYIANSRLDSGD